MEKEIKKRKDWRDWIDSIFGYPLIIFVILLFIGVIVATIAYLIDWIK
ncbi:hypothetical protein KKA15_06855 [Patescibacteria group bacterium]|nr:hypothetical protein [Patescibacteria group bacterium]